MAGPPLDSAPGDPAKPSLRFLFFLYHAGYLRHYAEPLRLLARDGHVVHLAFTTIEKDAGDRVLAERLTDEFPTITFGEAPTRAYFDGWRRTGLLVRALTDLTRYVDPRYAGATALRTRMAQKIKLVVASAKSDPVSDYLLTKTVDRVAGLSDAATAKRVLRFLVAAEEAIPTSSRIDRFIRSFRPDAVLATPVVDFASIQVEYLKSAARLNVPTGICVASWDNLTNKGLLRFTPDRVFVWNELQCRELEEFHGVPRERAVVTGGQKFDEWFRRRPSREPSEFAADTGLDPAIPFVLYVCSSYFIAPDEVGFVREWLEALRTSGHAQLSSLGVVVRPHPQNSWQWEDVDLSSFGNAVVWPPGGAQPDVESARADFFDSLVHSAAVIGINTTAMIEAAIAGRNVLTIADPRFTATQEGTLHFRYLLREHGGFLQIAESTNAHLEQLAEVLRSEKTEAERVRAFIGSFVRPHGLDVPAAPIVARGFAALASSRPLPRPAATPAVRALRAALLVPTAMVTTLTLLGAALHRVTKRDATTGSDDRRGKPASTTSV